MHAADLVILFAHLQPALVRKSVTNAPELIEVNAVALAEAAELLGIPMFFSLVPQDGGDTAPLRGLARHARGDNSFVQMCASPFMDPRLVSALEATRRRTLVVAGFATEAVTLFVVRDALAANYRPVVALDAGGGRSDRTEAAALRQMERGGATVTAVVDIIMSCAPDFSASPGKEALTIVGRMMAARG